MRLGLAAFVEGDWLDAFGLGLRAVGLDLETDRERLDLPLEVRLLRLEP